MKIIENVSLKEKSNIKIGGIAKEIIYIESYDDFTKLLGKDLFVLGNCSNILFSDDYIDKSFIILDSINSIEEIEKGIYEVGAGLKFTNFISYLNKKNYGGLEELAGIPGTVGGLTAINAGAYGKEIFENILEVEYFDKNLNLFRKKIEDIEFSYRSSEFKKNKDIITKVVFKTQMGYDLVKVLELLTQRKNKQPLDYPNLGSVFKNPENNYAAKLLEKSNLKGVKVGGAKVSTKHANFIINYDNAKFEDVIELIEICKQEVYSIHNINLEEEIIIVK
ncbi:MAG: UDP-N-acetylmuramate dehydrogenase [Fusobacteria bacterium]|nr:UDP-N-acetylmuramate dehydrogenase [Fusobacteriota bacterium]